MSIENLFSFDVTLESCHYAILHNEICSNLGKSIIILNKCHSCTHHGRIILYNTSMYSCSRNKTESQNVHL